MLLLPQSYYLSLLKARREIPSTTYCKELGACLSIQDISTCFRSPGGAYQIVCLCQGPLGGVSSTLKQIIAVL